MPARLEALTPGSAVSGLMPGTAVTAVAVEWHGSSCVTLTYRTPSGEVAQRLVYRTDEPDLDVATKSGTWTLSERLDVNQRVAAVLFFLQRALDRPRSFDKKGPRTG